MIESSIIHRTFSKHVCVKKFHEWLIPFHKLKQIKMETWHYLYDQ